MDQPTEGYAIFNETFRSELYKLSDVLHSTVATPKACRFFSLDPDAPVIGKVTAGDNSANVSWIPSGKTPPENPGSNFYVEYRPYGMSLWIYLPYSVVHSLWNLLVRGSAPCSARYSSEENVEGDFRLIPSLKMHLFGSVRWPYSLLWKLELHNCVTLRVSITVSWLRWGCKVATSWPRQWWWQLGEYNQPRDEKVRSASHRDHWRWRHRQGDEVQSLDGVRRSR